MEARGACAVCGLFTGRLDPYRDIAKANDWPHAFAHLGCARYRVPTVAIPEQPHPDPAAEEGR